MPRDMRDTSRRLSVSNLIMKVGSQLLEFLKCLSSAVRFRADGEMQDLPHIRIILISPSKAPLISPLISTSRQASL